jgi:GMP synthase (glutamine-hydrolysing)
VKILIVDNHTKHLTDLQKLVSDLEFQVCRREDFSVSFTENFDVIIFTGGSGADVYPVKNYELEYEAEINFIKNTDKKIIGICLGCEIVATALGCTLKELKSEERGIINIKFGTEDIPVYEAHRFIVSEVSGVVEILATSKDGIEAIKHKTRPVYGLQFHPEMSVDGEKGKKIFLEILGKR